MENKQSVKPKGIHIEVTENGVLTANVLIPYVVAKMGLKLGQAADNAKEKGNTQDQLERLKDIDLEAILEALDSDEMTLPCLLTEVDEADNNRHVKITLE